MTTIDLTGLPLALAVVGFAVVVLGVSWLLTDLTAWAQRRAQRRRTARALAPMARAFDEVKVAIGTAMLPTVARMGKAFAEFGEAVAKSERQR